MGLYPKIKKKNEKTQINEEPVLILGFLEMVRVPYVAVTHWTEQVLSLSPSTETHEFSHLSFSSNGRSSKMGGALKDIASNSELDNLRQSGAPVLITLYRDANPNFPTPSLSSSRQKYRSKVHTLFFSSLNFSLRLYIALIGFWYFLNS